MEAYFEAKASLFTDALLAGGAVVNSDDPWGAQLAQRLAADGRHPCWRSSLVGEGAELRVADLELASDGMAGTLITPVGEGRFRSPLVGRFNLMNLLQAVGVLAQQGVPLPLLLQGLASFRGVPGRMERVSVGSRADLPAVLVDYAHTPDGLENALAAARPFTKGRLICVFGCGGDKRPIMGAIASEIADLVIITTDNARSEEPATIAEQVMAGVRGGADVRIMLDRRAAIDAAITAARAGDIVLVAGKGHERGQTIGTVTHDFDDMDEARGALLRVMGGAE